MSALALQAVEPDDVSAALLNRARQGDEEAFATIVHVYDRRLRGLAYRVLGDTNRMDDALQEAYVRAFRALPRFRGDARLSTWLFRITYNACLDELIAFRSRHFEYAVNYIEKKVDNPIATGGTPYVPWLRQLIEETKGFYLA